MATSTYDELVTRIQDLSTRSDVASLIPGWIGDFEAKANRWLRERRMQQRATASISDEFSALPSDYAESMVIVATDGSTSWELDPAAPETIADYATLGQTGRPLFFAVVGEELRFYPTPDQTYSASLTYYRKVPALSETTQSNWLLEDAPDAYVQGAMAGFYEWDRDEDRSDRALAKAEQILGELKMAMRTLVGPLRTEVARALPRTSWNIRTDF